MKGVWMELTPKQQAVDLVKKAQNILILTHSNPDGDALGASLALTLALRKIGKQVTVGASGEVAKIFKFLPALSDLVDQINTNRDFVIELDLTNAKIDKMGYKKIEDKKLNIVITPKEGQFSPEDVQFYSGGASYDLIFVLDCADLERLGKLYDDNSALFYEATVINVDHHAGNDYFGKINWVELTATSTSEIISGFIESLGREKNLLDEEIATALLTGITTDTGSFQNANTTPKSLTIAAQLVAAGARQQDIVRHIYKTKSLTTLKLWGEIMQNLHSEELGFVWSEVDSKTISALGANAVDTSGVIDEMKAVPDVDFVLLLSEREGGVHGSLRSCRKGVDVRAVAGLFGGGGHEAASGFVVPDTTLIQQRNPIIERIREYARSKRGPEN